MSTMPTPDCRERTTILPIAGSEHGFSVRRVFCVGRNYAAHAREMGGAPEREAPFFFTKFADAVIANPSVIDYPCATAQLHHEVELVVALSKGGHQLAAETVRDLIAGYAVGIDLTRRDLQAELKSQGRPWDMAKNFDQSAPMSALHPVTTAGHLHKGAISLSVNGAQRQAGDLADMIWSVEEIIAQLSRYLTLRPGDLIMTGTPSGVGPLNAGDRVEASIAGLSSGLDFLVR